MGLFGKLLKPKLPTQNLAVYQTNLRENLCSVFLDLSLKNIAPVKQFKFLHTISIDLNNPREDGLPNSEEFGILYRIEDELIKFINEENIYAGRLSFDKKFELLFYSKSKNEYKKSFQKIMNQYEGYSYSIYVKPDIEWSTYKIIYPSPIQYQIIQNNRLYFQLHKNGDNTEIKREIDHWLFFENEKGRELFLGEIEDENFTVKKIDKIQSDEECKPYRLHIVRQDRTDIDSINNICLPLWEVAKKHGGEYDGWETVIVKKDS